MNKLKLTLAWVCVLIPLGILAALLVVLAIEMPLATLTAVVVWCIFLAFIWGMKHLDSRRKQ